MIRMRFDETNSWVTCEVPKTMGRAETICALSSGVFTALEALAEEYDTEIETMALAFSIAMDVLLHQKLRWGKRRRRKS